jgi:hypothetical protein
MNLFKNVYPHTYRFAVILHWWQLSLFYKDNDVDYYSQLEISIFSYKRRNTI